MLSIYRILVIASLAGATAQNDVHKHTPKPRDSLAAAVTLESEQPPYKHVPTKTATNLSAEEHKECEKTLCRSPGETSQSNSEDICTDYKAAGYPCQWTKTVSVAGGEKTEQEAHCSHIDKCATNFTRFCAHNVAGWEVSGCMAKLEL